MYRFLPVVCIALYGAPAWAQGVPGAAVGILEQTDAARKSVANKDKTAAIDHIRKSLLLVDTIKKSWTGGEPILVPVAVDTETSTTWTPVKKSREDGMSADRLTRNSSAREVERQTTTSVLDVSSAAERLKASLDAVEQYDWNTAASSLDAIPRSIIQTQSTDVVPLLKARTNLDLARARVLEQKFKDAAAPLRSAAEALAAYGKQSRGPHATEAESMRKDIEALANHVGSRRDDALEQIGSWLETVRAWDPEARR